MTWRSQYARQESAATVSRAWRAWPLDLTLILLVSVAAQATHFSYKQGRALISGDSTQYVAAAEALTDPNATPHFEMRKPGYAFYLAGLFLAFGNMGWAAVAGHHALLALLPLAAYGWGCHLHSRWAGWAAAVMTMARLSDVIWGDRMMSEALFTCLFSFGLLVFVVGIERTRAGRLMLIAGVLLGLSWLTRGVAAPAIVIAFLTLPVMLRPWWRACASGAWFAAPILCCVLLECALNMNYAGQFRPADGTVGATLLLRARHFEGFDLPDTPDADRVYALLPERDRSDAYVASHLDVWVARHRAIHDLGMSEWEYDELMGRVGWAALRENLPAYLWSSCKLTAGHLLRQPDGQIYSPVPKSRRAGHLIHPSATVGADWHAIWFAYYGLPHMSQNESIDLVNRMNVAAVQRAPFGGEDVWRTLRYWKTKPSAAWSQANLARLGSLWPGFALLGFWLLGLNPKACILLAAAYLFDAVFLGLLTPTNFRLQFIWIVTDTALAAGLLVGGACTVARFVTSPAARSTTPVRPLAG